MLAKRLGLDVREGKRRQFDFIGKSLREVEPELMDASIEATKDGDESRLRALSVLEAWFGEDNDKGGEDFEHDHGEEEGVPGFYLLLKKRREKSALPTAATQSFICILLEEKEFSLYGLREESTSLSLETDFAGYKSFKHTLKILASYLPRAADFYKCSKSCNPYSSN
ncbi:uncharacterized protein LOC120294600 isoform X1 [Eucalyptus grandis]|uniref:uncharacterized protein LOC120294600 isoform X1 n=1 Tax=Eucalyptus grandis TaxID=71139 RepID=UPI00192ED22D|nr:uncharacterized protein LOC120294600 isoform X1 [Eucalyptus grandis]